RRRPEGRTAPVRPIPLWVGRLGARADTLRTAPRLRRCPREGGPGRGLRTWWPAGPVQSVDDDVDQAALIAPAETHRAGGQGEESVVASPSDIYTGVDPGSALAHDHGAGVDGFTIEHLGSESL